MSSPTTPHDHQRDLEAGGGGGGAHHPPTPMHHEPRAEADLSATGVNWDETRHEWYAEDDRGEGETTSQETAVVRAAAAAAGGNLVAGAGSKTADRGEPTEKGAATAMGDVDVEPIWLEWEEGDPENPYHWSSGKKWVTTWITCLFTLMSAWQGAGFAIGSTSMIKDLNCSHELAAMGLSAFTLGFGVAPLVLAPFSEAYGRFYMYAISAVIVTVFYIPIGLAKNIATVIVSRLIGGLAASTGSTMVGGTISDIFESHNRGLPMSLFALCAFAGTGLGPALMGYVELNLKWRWMQWIQMILMGVLTLSIFLFTKETRGSVLLSRRAARMRKETGDQRYQCRSDAERASLVVLIRVSMTRPIYLLFTEPIVAAFSLWVGMAWGTLYLALEAVPLVFTEVYHFNLGEVGLVFYTAVFAAGIGWVTNLYQEKLYRSTVAKRGPEARLYASCVGGLAFPAGLFIFAFSQGRGHWMGPTVGLALTFSGVFTIYLATFNYLADCYTLYASSALSGQSLCRNLSATAFPLFTTQMYQRLGFQWASFLAGCIGLVLASTPFVLLAFGPRIRAASKFSKELERMRQAKK
ncbi:MFS general substrate transporter [Meredithblackwellia eburnea MCA 4105]